MPGIRSRAFPSSHIHVQICLFKSVFAVKIKLLLFAPQLCLLSIATEALKDLGSGAQLCCSVLDSIGGAESYSVSVSWVGSPANVQGFDSVPAPQSQKNLWVRV